MKCEKHTNSWIGLNGPGYCPECASERSVLGPSDATDCSPSLIADPDGKHLAVCRLQLASVVKERDELAGYLCRIKLPLPIRFVADLAELFPGKNIRMKDEGGYLCIFSENKLLSHPC